VRPAKWIANRWLGLVSPPVILAVVVATIPLVPACGYRRAGTASSIGQLSQADLARQALLAKQATCPLKPSPAERLTNNLANMTALLISARKKLARGKSALKELAALTDMRQELVAIDRAVRTDFAHTRKILAKIHAPEKDRIEASVEATYAARMASLASQVALATATEDTATRVSRMTSLASWIASATPELPHQPLGTQLPHRIVDYRAGPPVLGTAIAPAYAPNTPGAVPSTLPATPTGDDLTQTVEVQFTEDILKTANELGRDPVKMYEFVRNTIDYEPYYGSRKGANETLWEKAGNDFDQASLLIALYRYSGIPARYVQGVVEIPIAKAMNWVGVEKPEAAAKLFSAAGVPVKAIMSGGKIVKLEIEHCWAEAYVPYESYRGVAAGAGAGKRQWVALDASWKRYSTRSVPDSGRGVAAPLDATMTAEGASLFSIDETNSSVICTDMSALRGFIDEAQGRVASYAQSVAPSMPVSELTSARVIAGADVDMLPSAMPFRGAHASFERSQLTTSCQSRIAVQVGGSSVEFPIASVLSKRLSVSFVPSTGGDRALLEATGGQFDAPAYLLAVVPAVRVNGTIVATGTACQLGAPQQVTEVFRDGNREETVANSLTAGEEAGLLLSSGRVPDELVGETLDEIRAEGFFSGFRVPPGTDPTGESLCLANLLYMAELEHARKVIASALHVVAELPVPTAGRTVSAVDVHSLLGIPSSLSFAGPIADMDQLVETPVPVAGPEGLARMYMLASGAAASLLEEIYMEQYFRLQAVSTISLLSQAATEGVPIYVLNKANYESVMPSLKLPESVKQDIRSAAAGGRWVLVPGAQLHRGEWAGVGYLLLDPQTGAGGYMVSGGFAGTLLINSLSCLGELYELYYVFTLQNGGPADPLFLVRYKNWGDFVGRLSWWLAMNLLFGVLEWAFFVALPSGQLAVMVTAVVLMVCVNVAAWYVEKSWDKTPFFAGCTAVYSQLKRMQSQQG
jgi:hypothetical protein